MINPMSRSIPPPIRNGILTVGVMILRMTAAPPTKNITAIAFAIIDYPSTNEDLLKIMNEGMIEALEMLKVILLQNANKIKPTENGARTCH